MHHGRDDTTTLSTNMLQMLATVRETEGAVDTHPVTRQMGRIQYRRLHDSTIGVGRSAPTHWSAAEMRPGLTAPVDKIYANDIDSVVSDARPTGLIAGVTGGPGGPTGGGGSPGGPTGGGGSPGGSPGSGDVPMTIEELVDAVDFDGINAPPLSDDNDSNFIAAPVRQLPGKGRAFVRFNYGRLEEEEEAAVALRDEAVTRPLDRETATRVSQMEERVRRLGGREALAAQRQARSTTTLFVRQAAPETRGPGFETIRRPKPPSFADLLRDDAQRLSEDPTHPFNQRANSSNRPAARQQINADLASGRPPPFFRPALSAPPLEAPPPPPSSLPQLQERLHSGLLDQITRETNGAERVGVPAAEDNLSVLHRLSDGTASVNPAPEPMNLPRPNRPRAQPRSRPRGTMTYAQLMAETELSGAPDGLLRGPQVEAAARNPTRAARWNQATNETALRIGNRAGQLARRIPKNVVRGAGAVGFVASAALLGLDVADNVQHTMEIDRMVRDGNISQHEGNVHKGEDWGEFAQHTFMPPGPTPGIGSVISTYEMVSDRGAGSDLGGTIAGFADTVWRGIFG